MMALTDGGKDWLAINAGVNNCFASSGVSYKDLEGNTHTGSTTDVAAMLVVAALLGYPYTTKEIVNGKSYDDFRKANGDYDLDIDDVGTVYEEQEKTPPYCAAVATPTTSPTPICSLRLKSGGVDVTNSEVVAGSAIEVEYNVSKGSAYLKVKSPSAETPVILLEVSGSGTHTTAGLYELGTYYFYLEDTDCYAEAYVTVVEAAPTPVPNAEVCAYVESAGKGNLTWNHVLAIYNKHIGLDDIAEYYRKAIPSDKRPSSIPHPTSWDQILGVYNYYIGLYSVGDMYIGCGWSE